MSVAASERDMARILSGSFANSTVRMTDNASTMRRFALALVIISATALAFAAPAQTPVRTLIRNARVIDGTGTAPRAASVRIAGDRIVEVGDLTPADGERVVDAGGLAVAPGFIDTHSHHDRGLATAPDAPAMLSQGITTIVVGQDGGGSTTVAETLARFEKSPYPSARNHASHALGTFQRLAALGSDAIARETSRHNSSKSSRRTA